MKKFMEYQSQDLTGILHYGYFVRWPFGDVQLPFSVSTLEAARDERRLLVSLDEAALCAHGIRLWQKVCRRVLEAHPGPFVLPLSAGLDSRAILAGLVDQGAAGINTVTYGVPGSFDYEIAPAVACEAGVPHERINLDNTPVAVERLDEIASEPGRISFLLDMYFNRVVSDRYGPDYAYLSGYLGDVLAGKNLGGEASSDWAEARRLFAEKNRHSRTARLTPPGADPTDLLPEQPLVNNDLLGFDEQLDYAVRQECLMRPIVTRPDYNSIAPMLDPEWVAFMLALSTEQRRGRRLFKQIFRRGFPTLFELPTTANGGLPLTASERRVRLYQRLFRHRRRLRTRLQRLMPSISVPLGNRKWQYIDFRAGLRERKDLAALVGRSARRINAKSLVPWIDAEQLLKEHNRGEAEHGKALGVLLNLDILSSALWPQPSANRQSALKSAYGRSAFAQRAETVSRNP